MASCRLPKSNPFSSPAQQRIRYSRPVPTPASLYYSPLVALDLSSTYKTYAQSPEICPHSVIASLDISRTEHQLSGAFACWPHILGLPICLYRPCGSLLVSFFQWLPSLSPVNFLVRYSLHRDSSASFVARTRTRRLLNGGLSALLLGLHAFEIRLVSFRLTSHYFTYLTDFTHDPRTTNKLFSFNSLYKVSPYLDC